MFQKCIGIQRIQVNKRTRVSHYMQSVIAVKNYPANGEELKYHRVHVSLQLTSSCNIHTNNILYKCHFYIRRKQRGKGINKRIWGIEMNNRRYIYLSGYNGVDKEEYFNRNTYMYFRS